MRNLKRALSLALASVMLLGMMVVGTGAFEDVTESHNEEAIAVMELAGIMIGDDKGNFNPDKNVTRNEMAVVMANMLGLDVEDYAGIAPFTDVPAWAEAYVSACYANKIVSGTSATTYSGDANVTAVEAGLMVMKAMDYFQYASDFGSDWKVATIKQASKIDLYEDVKAKTNDALTRNEVAQICFNALNTEKVSYVESNLAVNDNGALHNVYTYYTAEGKNILKDELFGNTKTDYLNYTETTNDLDQKVVTWTLAVKGEKDATATVLKAAELTYVNYVDPEDVAEDLKDAEIKLADGYDAETANGRTVYVYEDGTTAKVDKVLATVDAIADDLVSTADEDERAIQIDGMWIVAEEDTEKGKDGVEIDNFEALYKALEEEDQVIIVIAGKADDGYIYSVEIPEIVTDNITRVKGDDIVAGGKSYVLAYDLTAKVAQDQELVVLDGVVYAVKNAEGEDSEIVYVAKIFDVEEDKWGNKSQVAQIITEDYEIVEVPVEVGHAGLKVGFATYDLNDDDEYFFAAASTTDVERSFETDDTRIDGKYVADGVKFVYIEKVGKSDMTVTVKEGMQTVTLSNVEGQEVSATYTLNDDKDINVVYVFGAYDDGITEDVVFVADDTDYADVENLDGKSAKEYTVYVDGKEESWMISNAKDGFWTYDYDEKTGEYKLIENKGKTVDVTEGVITKDKFVNFDSVEDATVTGDIYDLTDEGLTTLKKIAAWDGDALEISFMYDSEDNVITALYVEFK